MSKLSDQISARLKSLDISATKAAEQFGVNEAGLRRAIAGKAVPNKRTFGAYAKLLDVGVKEVEALVVDARGTAGGKGKAKAKPAAKGKAAKAKAKAAKPARGARRGSLAAAVAQLEETLIIAENLASDPLVRKVAGLSSKQRAIVELLLKSI